MMRNIVFTWSRLAVLGLLLLPAGVPTAAASAKMPVIAKWGRFEQAFKSSVIYSNAVQDASLKVLFTSPLGETNEVDGFWDGGRTWRVRFAPDQPGRWTFKTTCSDAANDGLHNQTGEFLCTAATGPTRFHKHGPVRVARDHRHLEHADGTPFFWLADTVWDGARAAEPKDWEFYARNARVPAIHRGPMGGGARRRREEAVRLHRLSGAHRDQSRLLQTARRQAGHAEPGRHPERDCPAAGAAAARERGAGADRRPGGAARALCGRPLGRRAGGLAARLRGRQLGQERRALETNRAGGVRLPGARAGGSVPG